MTVMPHGREQQREISSRLVEEVPRSIGLRQRLSPWSRTRTWSICCVRCKRRTGRSRPTARRGMFEHLRHTYLAAGGFFDPS